MLTCALTEMLRGPVIFAVAMGGITNSNLIKIELQSKYNLFKVDRNLFKAKGNLMRDYFRK